MNQVVSRKSVAMKRELEHYLRFRYPIELIEAEEGGYFARIPDLPGCMAQGETIDETLKSLEGAKSAWIEVRLEDGLDIPPPREVVDEYSGKFLLRVPKSLHRELATRAREEGTSLNQYALHLLSLGLGIQRRTVQPLSIEKVIDLERFAHPFARSGSQLYYYLTGRRAHQADLWNQLLQDPFREEAEQLINVGEFRNWFQISWGTQEQEKEEPKRKALEALSNIGRSLEGHLAPTA